MRGEGPGGRPRWGACSGTGWLTPGAGGHKGPLPSSSSSPAPTGRPAPFQKNLYLKGGTCTALGWLSSWHFLEWLRKEGRAKRRPGVLWVHKKSARERAL